MIDSESRSDIRQDPVMALQPTSEQKRIKKEEGSLGQYKIIGLPEISVSSH